MDIDLVSYPYVVLGGVVIVLVLWNYVPKRSQLSHLPLPPGPKGFPIIGSLFEMPHENTWLVYDDWFKNYGMLFRSCLWFADGDLGSVITGDMFYFKVLGQGFFILGSVKRTTDLLEKRAINYSDRPKLPMLIDL